MTATFIWTVLLAIINSALVTSSKNMSLSKQENTFNNVSAACNGFTNPLYKALSASTNDNLVTSPLSLHMVLSLLSNGAGGQTLAELTSALHHDDTTSLNDEFSALLSLLNDIKDIELHIANTAYIQDDFELLADFLSVCTSVFQSSISRTDFRRNVHAAETINSWVREATNNKISDIISSDDIDEDTRVVLVNAVYFKSKWLHPFDPKLTESRRFYVSKTEINLVPTMFKKSRYAHGEIPDWHAKFIEIPYLNRDIVMVILLPNEDIELQTMENNFNWETLARASRHTSEIELYLPCFKLEVTMDLKNILHKIGLNTMFGDNANFKRLSSTPLKVSKTLQKIFIEVNEEGSEAAAATAVVVRLKRAAFLAEQFMVNRPFMFAIEHKPSKAPLFLGSVRKIESSEKRDEL